MQPTADSSAKVQLAKNTIIHEAIIFEEQPLVRQLIDAVPDILIILNQERRVVYSNEALLSLTHLPFEAVLGNRLGNLLKCAHAVNSGGNCGSTKFCPTCGAFQAMIGGLEGVQNSQECRVAQVDGDALDLRVWATPLVIDDRVYAIFTANDISSEKRRRALERVFFHDVLNTAGVLSTYTKMIEMGDADDLLPRLNEIAERLIDEINAQKELLAAENHELSTVPHLVCGQNILEKLAQQYVYYGSDNENPIAIKPCDAALTLVTDYTLLMRVLGNMLKNAIEASQKGDTVTLACEADEDNVTFSVHNPAFMPREVRYQIFKRSFSTKGPGHGLGTYSMKLLTERYLFGKIHFTSTAEAGTSFYATYPREWQGSWRF